ncbi:hypothetical protein RB195_008814 [Necator americanus]|uniref:STI1 domain-containing protein n=1 Tax=Necator americanus TaxID=51031 RepID=A0ABR1CQI4_NECAM
MMTLAKKIQEYNRAVARQVEERELRERRERVRKAQEANRKAQEEAAKFADEDFGGMGGGDPTGGLGSVLNDPEVAEAIKDPEVMSAFLDIMNNPSNLMKHMGNPKVMKLIAKMKDIKAPGMGGMFGGGAAPGGCHMGPKCGDSGCGGGGSASSAPPKAPEPDLD